MPDERWRIQRDTHGNRFLSKKKNKLYFHHNPFHVYVTVLLRCVCAAYFRIPLRLSKYRIFLITHRQISYDYCLVFFFFFFIDISFLLAVYDCRPSIKTCKLLTRARRNDDKFVDESIWFFTFLVHTIHKM